MTGTTESANCSPGDKVVVLPTESSKMTATWKGPFAQSGNYHMRNIK